jgi:hypothetical protein
MDFLPLLEKERPVAELRAPGAPEALIRVGVRI